MKIIPGKLAELRKDYQKASLDFEHAAADPIMQFDQWFKEAVNAEILEPNAMTLASCSAEGRPSARILLLKDYNEEGFIFYTNYDSQKGKELQENPFAAMVFAWLELERQIRIEGRIEKVSRSISDQYFASRPKGSQIGAWASPQSSIIDSRKILEDNVENLKQKYQDAERLPLPPHWGGFRLIPEFIEFWQGRSSRLHDRIRYQRIDNQWKLDRLAP